MDVDARDENEAPEVPEPKEAKMKQLQRSQIRHLPSEGLGLKPLRSMKSKSSLGLGRVHEYQICLTFLASPESAMISS